MGAAPWKTDAVFWRAAFSITVVAGAVGVAAPTATARAKEEPPRYLASGPIENAPNRCRRVLVIGDSLSNHAAIELPGQYARYGYCATVINAAKNGSNAWIVDPTGRLMFDLLANKLDKKRADMVVMEFVGNAPPEDIPTVQDSYLALIDLVESRGLPVFVSTPIVCGCGGTVTPWITGHQLFRQWQLEVLPTLRPDVVYSPWADVITPNNTYWESLMWPAGPRAVRTAYDCLHFTVRGARVAAREWIIATQREWTHARPQPQSTDTVVTRPPTPGPNDRPLPGA